MTVPSGADITIGTDDFFIAEELPDHWNHALADAQTFFSVQEAGPRVQHATLFHNNRYQYMSDWTQGENSQSWGNQVDNDAYDQSYVNTRVPGRFSTRPVRVDVTTGFTAAIANANARLQMATAAGDLWISSGGNNLWYSAGVTWTNYNLTGLSAGQVVRSIVGDGPYLYVFVSDTPLGNGKVKILRLNTSAGTQVTVLNDTGTNNKDCAALVHHGGVLPNANLFAWSGTYLRAYDVTDATAFPFTNSKTNLVFKTSDDDPASNPLFADAIQTDNGIAFMSAYLGGDTRVYQGKDGAFGQIFKLPVGFTGHSLAFNGGLLLIVGEYEGRAAAFLLSMQTLQSTFVDYFRPWKTGTLVAASAGPGSQFIITHSTEGVFIYDYIKDAISALDYHKSDHTNLSLDTLNQSDVGTFNGNRYAILPLNATDFTVVKWNHDLTNSTASGSDHVLYSPEWDFGFVNSTKVMLGVFLEFLPLASGDSIQIDYKIEEDGIYNTFPSSPSSGVWTSLGSASFASDGAVTTKYLDLALAGTSFLFRHVRFRATIVGKPFVTQISPRVEIGPGQETFTIIVRLRDEVSEAPGSYTHRPSNRQAVGEDLRSTLWGYARSRLPVTFLDGYSWRNQENKYDTYKVVIEEPQDDIDTQAQGEMKLTLRRVDGNSMA